MNLQEALKALQEGKIMCRAAWPYSDGYLTYMVGMSHVWKIQLLPNPNAGNYIFSLADLLGNDWQEFVLNKEVEIEINE